MTQQAFASSFLLATKCFIFYLQSVRLACYRERNESFSSCVNISRLIIKQPASPVKLAAGLANLHKESVSPTGKFGFHVATCHAKIAQAVNSWDDSWCALYTRHLGHVMDLAKPILKWPEFDVVCKLTLEKVVPRLLLPLQSEGRVLKPCLIHGDCWDGKLCTHSN